VIARAAAALRRTARVFADRPRAALWTTLALTCALLAVGVAGVAALTVDRIEDTAAPSTTEGSGLRSNIRSSIRSSAGLVVYLGEDVSEQRATQLVDELRRLSGVDRVELVSAEETGRRVVGALGSGANLLEGVDVDSLPSSVEITLAPGVRDVVAMSPIVRELRGTPGVSDVVVEDTPDDRVSAAFSTVRAIAWTSAILFAGLALITALASIRVRLDASRREYRVVEMLGGGPSFIIFPTVLAGALQGLVAALLAGCLLWIGIEVYGDGAPFELALPSALMVLAFVGGGAAIGLVGGGLAGISRTSAS